MQPLPGVPVSQVAMSITHLLLLVLVLLVVFSAPTWNHSRSWGYAPSGGLGLVLVILLVLFLLGKLG